MTATAYSDLRARVADALNDPTGDVTVHADIVDSLTPPAYLLVWGDPWTLPATFCSHTVRLDVVCIAGRIDPGPGIATLEEMVAVALNRLRAAGLPEVTVAPPIRFDVGGVPYLAARLSLDARMTIPDPTPIPSDAISQESGDPVLLEDGDLLDLSLTLP